MLVMVLASAGLITACGGGGGGVETGNGGVATTTNSTATTVSGTISGLGSVIVNGIRYETIGAAVRDMDDNRVISRPLGLGMTVKLEPSTTRAAAAGMIHVLSGIKGGISATNSAAKTLNVAGLPVTTDATTFIVTAAGTVGRFTDLTNGQAEVYGLPQSDGTFKATLHIGRDEAVKIEEGATFPPELCNDPKPPTPSKTKIKAAIKAGEAVAGARIVRKDRLTIK